MAHARVLSIEPFENSLRENTPLTSINDPKALVEYLNQLNLKGDMVLDELKRVSNDRDTYKQKLSEAEKSAKEAWDEVANLQSLKEGKGQSEDSGAQASGQRSDDGNEMEDIGDGDPLAATAKSPPPSIKSPTSSARGLSLFSTKSKAIESPQLRQGSEDLFSYDSEIPRLETEVQERDQKIKCLESEIKNLKGDLAVTRESTQSMVQTLEEATRELNTLRDGKERSASEVKEQLAIADQLRADLHAAQSKLEELQTDNNSRDTERISELEKQLDEARSELERMQPVAHESTNNARKVEELKLTFRTMGTEMVELRAESKKSEKRIETLNSLVSTLRTQLNEAEGTNQDLRVVVQKSSKAYEELQEKMKHLESDRQLLDEPSNIETPMQPSQSTGTELVNAQDTSNAAKKKNKKKKRGGKGTTEQEKETKSEPTKEMSPSAEGSKEPSEAATISRLQDELRQLRALLDEKDAAIDRIGGKLKDQDGLREEIETLRDDLVNVGQEHVEAKDKVKELIAEKHALQNTVADLEKDIAELRGAHASSTAGSEQKQQDLLAQFEELKIKATTLQTDLSAAQQLASSRFKDLNDLRNVLQKAQPEINTLRSEAAEAKSVKEALGKKEAEFKRLDSRHEEMRAEVAKLRQIIVERESEIKTLNQKIAQENNSKLKAEEAGSKAIQDAQRLETEKRQAIESLDRLSRELSRTREDLTSSKARLKELEQQLSRMRSESEGLKEEIDLKTAQYASAQSLMASMRDQTAEMAMQMKEARERCESLDEEVAEAHRLLGERSREGETMRRLLADVEGRADARTREMKERMDAAIEERDRAEEEAATAGRRRARELEDLRNKYRDLERNLKRAEEDKEELEIAQRDWKRRREELEHRASQSSKEFDDVRQAMGELRDALDESERQARELEKQKAELRRSVEDTQHRLEKLQKANKVCYLRIDGQRIMNTDYKQSMTEEISKIQAAKAKVGSEGPSSRTSTDSTPRVGSPAPSSRTGSATLTNAPNGQPAGTMDYVYLKNVLLQFLEQKDKKHQVQLIPVLGMLLHFDR